ncbi:MULTISPECIES: hypothetical protein [unclassified Rickettsia]
MSYRGQAGVVAWLDKSSGMSFPRRHCCVDQTHYKKTPSLRGGT